MPGAPEQLVAEGEENRTRLPALAGIPVLFVGTGPPGAVLCRPVPFWLVSGLKSCRGVPPSPSGAAETVAKVWPSQADRQRSRR